MEKSTKEFTAIGLTRFSVSHIFLDEIVMAHHGIQVWEPARQVA